MLRVFIAITFMVLTTEAFASFHTAKEGSKVFIIEGKEKPAKVVPAQKASQGHGVMMRMPNLDESSVVSVPSRDKDLQTSPKQASKIKKMKSKGQATKKAEVTTLRFSKAKINGALRLPRVKFSKIAPTVDIREEMPEMDFNPKTLSDSGF
jgi:hypothetical protein